MKKQTQPVYPISQEPVGGPPGVGHFSGLMPIGELRKPRYAIPAAYLEGPDRLWPVRANIRLPEWTLTDGDAPGHFRNKAAGYKYLPSVIWESENGIIMPADLLPPERMTLTQARLLLLDLVWRAKDGEPGRKLQQLDGAIAFGDTAVPSDILAWLDSPTAPRPHSIAPWSEPQNLMSRIYAKSWAPQVGKFHEV